MVVENQQLAIFLQNPADLLYRECEIGWENDIAVDIMVYNRRFRERNFKENIAGIFTLGQATIEDIQALEHLKEKRKKQAEDHKTRTETLKKKSDSEKKYEKITCEKSNFCYE